MTSGQIIDTRAQIETPENVQLSFRLAGPGSRAGAYLLDLSIRIAAIWVLALVVGVTAPFVASLSIGIFLVVLFLLEWFYGCFFEGFWGRTPGKWIMGLRVIKEGGYPIGFFDAVLRNLLRAADALPLFYGTGFLSMLLTARMQRLGDLLAGTLVIREKRERLRGELAFLHSVPVIPRSQMAASYRPSDRTLDLLEQFFLRRAVLTPARTNEIAAILARPLAERLAITSELPEIQRDPSRFLLRVLRTFSRLSKDDEAEGEAVGGMPATARLLEVP